MKKYFTLLAFTSLSLSLQAQQYRPAPSAEIYQKLQQLNVLGTVMYVAAHPDDENTRLISYLVHHDHVRTVYLSLTRGDGGQNILGNEQGSTLGLIRTHELIEARKIDGAEQLFSHVIDFGYTKSPDETFKFWNRAKLAEDVKAAFQQYHPDVIICRFPTTGEGGHGQHTVSAIVAGDAFKDLEQMKQSGKPVWVPTRLFFNAFRFGSMNTTSEDQFKVAVNQFDPLLGEGYGEMAGRSRSIHKSQGAGTPQSVGVNDEYFKLLAGKPVTSSLYDGIDLSWGRVGRREIGQHIAKVIDAFDYKDPSKSLPALAAIQKEINTVSDSFWKTRKLQELNDIATSCAGLMVEALTDNPESVAGKTIPVTVNVIARSSVPVSLESISFPATIVQGSAGPAVLSSDVLQSFKYDIRLNAEEPLTEPYWLRYAASTGAYQYDSIYAGAPETPNHLAAGVTIKVAGASFSAAAPVSYKKLDPVKGDVVQQLRIVPAVTVAPLHALFIYEEGKSSKVGIRVRTFDAVDNARLLVKFKDKELTALSLGQLRKDIDTLFSIDVPVAGLSTAKEQDGLLCSVEAGGKVYSRDMHLIQYPHLPDLQYFTDASMKIVRKDWKAAVKKIGYIEGAGDHVAEVLGQTGLDIDQVPESAMSNTAYLSQFDAIVLGVRAYNTRKQISSWMPVLLQYVANGGTLLVQYNTNQNLQTTQYGPYPFSISRDRVTEEDAKVTFTDPSARLLHFPNEIREQDFDHWVQERGIYYPAGLDGRYKTLLSMHDTGEKPLESAIIYAPYGKGQFIYTSLVFFRQLPAGNNGAIRLMMNLLSAGK
ncbi:PIG-L family deacetylase [Taibaiella koreensis]|uniref:PIG-L family deacetylase n=1 Tax=Taibaiella koreensis TaxID=1268548 RepID=UPI000E59DFC2|nr:PIG-L family deacetylase [Taibaiella koreensis]